MDVIMIPLMLVLGLALGAIVAAVLVDAYHQGMRAEWPRDAAELDALWRSLQAANRINVAFWSAHEALRREARRVLEGQDEHPLP